VAKALQQASEPAAAPEAPGSGTAALRGSVLEVLEALLREQRNDEVLALVKKLVARNSELERRLAELSSKRKSREGVSAAQLVLLLDGMPPSNAEELEDADEALRKASEIDKAAASRAKTRKPARRQPRLRRPLPDSLRRVANPLPVPDEERPCPICGLERECIGHDITEVVDFIPAEVIVRLDMREKLACKPCEGNLVRGPVGDKVVAGGGLGSRLVGNVIVEKYDHGLPLHRQKERFGRLGFPVAVSTLADQVTWGTDLLRPVARACLDEVLSAYVMHLDGTSLKVLTRKGGKRVGTGKKLGALWGFVGDDKVAAYVYASTGKKNGQRPGELGPEEILARRTGLTVADASSLFDASFARADLIECGCNMHARRYFVKALDGGDTRAALPLAAFKKIYDIEQEVAGADPPTRLAARQARSKSVYDELVTWCQTHQRYEPPSSPMGRAIRYLLNHREALMQFLDDGCIPPDNGVVERLHVRAALTRKNFLFAGSDAGGDRAAVAYTILGSCRLVGIDPTEYLADVLPRLARGIRLCDAAEFIPFRWKAARAAAAGTTDP